MAADSGTYTPETLQRRYKIAEQLLGDPKKPITHWAEGLNELAKGFVGGRMLSKADEETRASERAQSEAIARMLDPGAGQAAPPPPVSVPPRQAAEPGSANARVASAFDALDAPANTSPGYGSAIAGIESGGKYDALGPVTKTGDRAYGKYQVMGANVPQWTKAHLGREMTPEQFLADTQAQDAVFKGQFGQYANKYGPEGAARAWFAGEGGMNDPNRKDQLGTSVADYGSKFSRALGLQPETSAPASVATALNAPPSAPTAAPAGNDSRARVAAMLNDPNPGIRQMGRQFAASIIQQQMKPSDYDIQQRPDGTVIAVNKRNPQDLRVIEAPGAGQSAIDFKAREAAAVAKAKGEAEKLVGQEQRTKEEKQVGSVVVQDIDRAIKTMDTATLPTTGATGYLLSNIGGTAARDVAGLIDTVKANAGFAELQKMRNNSPTGGALGQVSEREIAYLQSTIGNLEQSQSKEQLQDNLRRVKNTYMDIVHGEGKGPPRETLKFQEQQRQGSNIDDLLKKYGPK
jgi:hypothetical protein